MPNNPERTAGLDYQQVNYPAIQHALDTASMVPNTGGETYSRHNSVLHFWAIRATESLPGAAEFVDDTAQIKGSVITSFVDGTVRFELEARLADNLNVIFNTPESLQSRAASDLLKTIAGIDLDTLLFEPRFATEHLTDVTNESYYRSPYDAARLMYATTAHKAFDDNSVEVCPAVLQLTGVHTIAGNYNQEKPTHNAQYIVDLRRAAVVNHMSVIYRQAAMLYPDRPDNHAMLRYGYGLPGLQQNLDGYLYGDISSAYRLGEACEPSMQIYAAYYPQSVQELETNLRGQSDFAKYVGMLAATDINALVAQPLTFAQTFNVPF